jgi:hypothetical protein
MMKKLRAAGICCATIAMAFSYTAHAGCFDTYGAKLQPSLFIPSEYGSESFQFVSDDDPRSIVGMWSVQYVSGGNVIDFGYAVWHADGTDFINSGGHAPSTQNYCLGVWKKTAPFTYKLKHLVLSYDTSGNLDAHVILHETVVVSRTGTSYSGPFTIDVYALDGTTLLQHVAGEVTGTRITVD